MPTPDQIRDLLFSEFEKGNFSNTDLVHIIELSARYLNLKTLTNYAKSEGISYNGAKKRLNDIVTIDNMKFIIDNE